MKRTILASAATIALTMGAAIAQELPPEAGLTPGAPLGTDPYTDRGVAVGESSLADQAFVGPTAIEPAMVEPIPAEPILAEPFPAEPLPAAPVGIAQVPVAPGAPVALAYPEIPSSAGLTPGAPLGADALTDRKVVVGEEPRAIGATGIFR
jgi:hypothetical protein